jgi:hypothetical protein
MRGIIIAVVAGALALAAPTVASAHTNSLYVNCLGGQARYVSTQGTEFKGTLYVNDVPAATWDVVAGQNGVPTTGTLPIAYKAPVGTFSVFARWSFSTGESSGLNRIWLTCSAPPAPPAPAPPAPVVDVPAAPADTPVVAVGTPLGPVTQPEVRRPKPHHRIVCRKGWLRLRQVRHRNGKRVIVVRCVRPHPKPTAKFLAG